MPAHPVLGRLRPAAPGPGRLPRVVRRAHRPAADRGARPLRPAPELGRALQGAAARVAGPARRPRHRDQPDPDVHLRRLHRADHPGHAAPGRHRRGAGQVPDQAISRAGRRRTAQRQGGLLPVQAVLRVLRARRHHGHRLRRRDHRDHLHLRLRRPGRPGADRRGGREAGLEGRLADALGLRAGDVRARRGRPLLARVQLHRRRGTGDGDLRRRDAAALRLLLRRHQRRVVEDERLGRRRAHPGGRAGDLRGPADPLAVRPAPSRAVHHPGLQRRGGPGLRRVGRAEPQGRRRHRRPPRPWRRTAARPGPPRGRCRSRRARCRSARWPRWRTSRPATRRRSCASCGT